MGPSKDFAVIKSMEAHDIIMQLLKDKYQVERPDENWGPVAWRDDWDKDEAILREALAALFWHSDAASF
jgi:hypothetical protein